MLRRETGRHGAQDVDDAAVGQNAGPDIVIGRLLEQNELHALPLASMHTF
jgi:hypothetical protein